MTRCLCEACASCMYMPHDGFGAGQVRYRSGRLPRDSIVEMGLCVAPTSSVLVSRSRDRDLLALTLGLSPAFAGEFDRDRSTDVPLLSFGDIDLDLFLDNCLFERDARCSFGVVAPCTSSIGPSVLSQFRDERWGLFNGSRPSFDRMGAQHCFRARAPGWSDERIILSHPFSVGEEACTPARAHPQFRIKN